MNTRQWLKRKIFRPVGKGDLSFPRNRLFEETSTCWVVTETRCLKYRFSQWEHLWDEFVCLTVSFWSLDTNDKQRKRGKYFSCNRQKVNGQLETRSGDMKESCNCFDLIAQTRARVGSSASLCRQCVARGKIWSSRRPTLSGPIVKAPGAD